MSTKSFKDFSGGYTRESAVFTEKICQLVYPSQNIDIYPKEDEGYGIKGMDGNTVHSEIEEKSIYNLWDYTSGEDEYLIAHTGDTVQIYNETTDEYTVLKDELDDSALNSSFDTLEAYDISEGTRYFGFFTNGSDAPFVYEKGTTPAVQDVTATGIDGRTITGYIAVAFDGRIWLVDGSNLYRSKQHDPFDFSTANDAGLYQAGSTIKALWKIPNALLLSTLNGFVYITPAGDGTYNFTNLSTNYAINHKSIVNFGNSSFYMSENGIYPIVVGNTEGQTGKTLSNNIDSELRAYSSSSKASLQLLDATKAGRDEVWLHIPTATKSVIYIFRGKKGHQDYAYWLPPRYQQPINCLHVHKGMVLSATSDGKVLRELYGSDYDGNYYASIAKTPKYSGGNYSWKVSLKPILFLNTLNNSKFYADTIISGDSIDYNEEYIEIITTGSLWAEDEDDENGMLWAEDENDADGGVWAIATLGRIDLDKAKAKSKESECSIQFVFKTKEAGDYFSIDALELTKIKKKNK